MTRSLLQISSIAVAVVAFCGPVAAQSECKEPTSNEWLRQAPAGKEQPVAGALVRPVTRKLPRAIALLSKESLVRLRDEEVLAFTGVTGASSAKRGSRPYLVRAVYPTGNPQIQVSWSGYNLHVFAEGLGCAPFIKRPIVVFLRRKPKHVFVMASAVL
jgi:hypothetical protein